MANEDIIKAWKDEEFNENLSDEARKQLPQNPAGRIEITDKVLSDLNNTALFRFGS